MKKIKFTGKLSLNKETIAKLNGEQMGSINGGRRVASPSDYTCTYFGPVTCPSINVICAPTTVTVSACGALPGQCGL